MEETPPYFLHANFQTHEVLHFIGKSYKDKLTQWLLSGSLFT
jgi:hypothetical protein